MSANTTIITAQEVIYYTPNEQGFDVNTIKNSLPLKEEGLFRVWLGLDWYDSLIADLADHTGFQHFTEGSAYATDVVVLWRDKLYKVTATPDSGGTFPSDTTKWNEAEKFQNTDNEYLWKRYLRTVLAWHIMHSSMVYNAIRQTNLGVVQAGNNENVRPVSGRNLSSFKSEVGEDTNDFLQTMDAYLRKNSSLFPLYLPNQQACNAPQQNVGFRDNTFGFTF